MQPPTPHVPKANKLTPFAAKPGPTSKQTLAKVTTMHFGPAVLHRSLPMKLREKSLSEWLHWFLVFLFAVALPVQLHAQAGSATVVATLGPVTPYYTDDVTATVTVKSASAPAPTGSITWNTDTGTQQIAALANGVARIELKSFAPGAHTFNYAYSGDGTYTAVASKAVNFNVADRQLAMLGSSIQLGHGSGPSRFYNLAFDSSNNLLVPEPTTNTLYRITPLGTTTIVPTSGLNNPAGIVVDKQNNIFIADTDNARVVEINASGAQSPLPISGLSSPVALAFDPAYSSLYVVDQGNESIVTFNLSAQTQTTFAPGLINLSGVAVSSSGVIYYAQYEDQSGVSHLFERDGSGNVTEIYTGIRSIVSLLLDEQGDLYLGGGTGLFVLDPQSHLTQLSTTSAAVPGTTGNIAMDNHGRIYVGGYLYAPGASAYAGDVYTQYQAQDPAFMAGGQYGRTITVDYLPPYQQQFTSVTVSSDGHIASAYGTSGQTNSSDLLEIYFSAQPTAPGSWSSYDTVTTTDGTQLSSLVYGNGVEAEFDLIPGTITPGSSSVSSVGGVTMDANGNVYVSDTAANKVVEVSGSTSTAVPFTGLNAPTQLAVDGFGAVYVLDSGTSRILRVDPAGHQTVAFDVNAQSALTSLTAFAMDGGDNLSVAGLNGGGQGAIYLLDTQGNEVSFAQNIEAPASMALDGLKNLYATETNGGNVRRYDSAGNPALLAGGLSQPSSIAVDAGGTVFVTGEAGSGITVVRPDGTTSSYPSASLLNASALASDGLGDLVVGDNTGKQIFGVTRSEGHLITYDFGNVALNTTAILDGSLSDAGNVTTVQWFLGGNQSETAFTSDPNECVANTSNTGLQPSGSCLLNISFTPTYLGSMSEYFNVSQVGGLGAGVLTGANLTGNGTTAIGAPAVSPNPLNFGSVTVNTTSATSQIVVQNNNSSALTISSVTITGANAVEFTQTYTNCTAAPVPAGSACGIQITFTPTQVGAATATVTITDNSTTSTSTVTLEGSGVAAAGVPAIHVSPASLSFPSTTSGASSAAQTIVVSNSGSAAGTISAITLGGANASAFSLTNGCGAALAANASCNLSVVFAPTAAGQTFGATVSVASNDPSSPATVTLSGSSPSASAPAATLTPATLTYSVTAGTSSAAQTAMLTNTGTATLNIASISLSGTNASNFTIAANACGSTLAAGASCAVSINFSPGATGSFTATLSVADDAAGSPQTSALSGTGTAAPATADFTLSAIPATQSVTAGSAAAYTVSAMPTGGNFTDAVALSAAGLPPGSTVSFAPAQLTPGATGAQSTMTVQTAASQSAHSEGLLTGGWRAPVFAVLFLFFPGWRARRRWNARLGRAFLTGVLLLGVMAGLIGCGSGFAIPQAKAGSTTYSITVTGTSGSVQHSTTVQITVK